MGWVRSGECNRCGDCCRTGDPFTKTPNVLCPVGRENPDGTVTCTNLRHPYFMAGCVVWPTKPEHIADKPRCSFTFEWVEDGD